MAIRERKISTEEYLEKTGGGGPSYTLPSAGSHITERKISTEEYLKKTKPSAVSTKRDRPEYDLSANNKSEKEAEQTNNNSIIKAPEHNYIYDDEALRESFARKKYEAKSTPFDISIYKRDSNLANDELYARGLELANKKEALTDDEKKEAAAIADGLKNSWSDNIKGFFSLDYARDKNRQAREAVASILETKTSVGSGIAAGLFGSMPLSSATSKRAAEFNDEILPGSGIDNVNTFESAQVNNPLAYAAGEVAGDIALLMTVSGAVGAAQTGISTAFPKRAAVLSKIPSALRGAFSSAEIFGVKGALDALNNIETKEEYANSNNGDASGYSYIDQASKVAGGFGKGAASGFAGGIAKGVVSGVIQNYLLKHGLMTPLNNVLENTISSFARSTANIATRYAIDGNNPYMKVKTDENGNPIYNEDGSPAMQLNTTELGKDLAVTLIWSFIYGMMDAKKGAARTDALLRAKIAEAEAQYNAVAASTDFAGRNEKIDELKNVINNIRGQVNNTYYPGGQAQVNAINEGFDAINSRLNELYTAESAAAGTGGFNFDVPYAIGANAANVKPEEPLMDIPVIGEVKDDAVAEIPSVLPQEVDDNTDNEVITVLQEAAKEVAEKEIADEPIKESEKPLLALENEGTNTADTYAVDEVLEDRAASAIAKNESVTDNANNMPIETTFQEDIDTFFEGEADISKIGESGKKALSYYWDGNGFEEYNKYVEGFVRFYEAGTVGLPFEQIDTVYSRNVSPAAQQAAYMAGVNDTQAKNTVDSVETKPEANTQPVLENFANENYTKLKESLSGYDVATVDGIKYSVDNKPNGYYIEIQRDDSVLDGRVVNARSKLYSNGPFATRQEAIDEILDVAARVFYPEALEQQKKESVDYGNREMGEVPDEGRVLESDLRRESDGGLLDELASENMQEDESGRNAVSAPEGRGREISGASAGDDEEGLSRGRSLGSSEGGNLLTSDRKITFEEEAAINFYKSGGSYTLNDELRRGTPIEQFDEYEQNIIKNLDSALEKLPIRKGKVYRNISFDMFGGEEARNEFMMEHEGVDAYVTYEAYTSASTEIDGYPIEDEFVVHMEIESVTGRDLEGYGDNSESEVLFARDTTFIVNRIEYASDGTPTIYMTEVENGEGRIKGTHKRDIETQSRESSSSEEGEMRRLHGDNKGNSEMQDVSERNTEGYSERQNELQQLQEESITEQEIEQKTEEAVQELPRGNNFSIPDKGLSLPKGEKARFKANIEAIKTLRKIMSENRYATPAEQEILSKYVGWGGLANAFDEKKTEWSKEYKQLKKLLTDKEYSSARGSTLNAHYTDIGVIRAMYKGLEGLGFKGGRLLEPSAGIGHFVGGMPKDMLAGVKSWTVVELDELTGNIAKYLYPNADVRIQGFEATKIPDNYMDVAISNVPFGNYPIVDKTYPKSVTGAIHNYFFAKSLDKVRPGGIVCFITSRYTMDSIDSSVRHYIAQRADLLGAIRLPDSAFKGNAGTEVVTDILILKKREPNTAYSGEAFENSNSYHYNLGIYERTNEYFDKHPEMVLGTPTNTGGMYRGNSLTYTAKEGSSLEKQIEKAFAKIKGKMDYPVKRTQEDIRNEIKLADSKGKNGGLVIKDGEIYRNNNGVLEKTDNISKTNEEKVKGIIGIRDAARELLNLQLDNESDAKISEQRKKLNTLYDEFVKKNGFFNSQSNKKLINLDADAPFILALEDYNKDTRTATKAAIFSKNTITPNVTITSVNTIEEGLTVSINETGGVDTARIAELLGESEEAITKMLLENKLAFKNRNGELESAEKYLSGNVKAKLRDAEALAEGSPEYQTNVEELRKIIPADIPAENISVRPGSTWVPDSVYGDFVAEMLGSRNNQWTRNADVTYNKLLGTYKVTIGNKWLKNRPENVSTWGTPDRSFINIFEATLNNKNVTVWRKTEDGGRILDKQATAAAQEKQEKIIAEFQKWLWDDETRKTTLVKLYNDIFNNTVTPKYDGSNLTVNGSNVLKPLRAHQKNAVQRIINSGGNTLLAHKVGAGKTYEMAAAAMKLRQLGIVKKPMFVVPKSLVAQWGNEFLDFFPAAKVLVLGEKDFSAANRKLFANRIATGDYDAVILSQEQFKAVPMSAANQEAFYQEQIVALELAIEETARKSGKREPSIKQMEKSKKSFEAKLKNLADMKKDENNIDFEELGVDALFVDEAHSYKNLFYTTNMSNVSGLGNKNGSQKAFDLYMKVRYLQKLNGGRGVVFATATPVMNSMSEMYIMQKYLQSDLLDARGLTSFDAWANQFGEVRTVLEMNPSGKGFRQKQSFSRFKNLAELQQMFRSFADVLTEIEGLKIPAMKEGRRIIVESEPSEFQMEYIEELAKRADAVKNRKVDPSEDNMLKITSDGRKLSYTQRMIDPSLPYEDDNKIMKCADNVLNIWKETKDIKGTQLIFCDLSTPKGSTKTETSTDVEIEETVEDISIYDDIRNTLIGAGVPAKEIAFIHEANTNEKKEKLFKDVNDGKVRVLIGSTGKMGVGMNAQRRIVALHHLDAPWRPGDIEQREGRALRQGNINEEVGIYVYVTKKTFDSRMWDNLERKASFIHQIMAGDLTARESEGDGDFALSAAEIKAISSGNPLIMEQFEVAAELAKVENLERAHNKEIADAKNRIAKSKLEIVSDEEYAKNINADIEARQDISGDNFKMTIGGKTFIERKKAGEMLIEHAKKHLKVASGAPEVSFKVGSFAGFELYVTTKGDALLRGKGQYRASINMQSAVGTIQSLEATVKRLDKMLEAVKTRLDENRKSILKLGKTINTPFGKADELERLRKRNAEILAELNPADEQNAAAMDDDGEEAFISTGSDNVMYSKDGGAAHPDQWTTTRVGDENKTPMRLSDIVNKIRKDFGINITTGHVRGKDVRGLYSKNNNGIRSKIANDLPTISHELGHYLDNKYGLTGSSLTPELKKELVDGLDEAMKDKYPKNKWTKEGLSEFVRKFLQNRETAAIDYPEFTKHFLNSMDAKEAALLTQLADEINAYYSLDADTATSSIRLSEESGKDFRTIKEKIKGKAKVFYQAWVDANHGIKLYDEATGSNAYTLANNAAYSDAVAGQIIIGDLTDINGQYVSQGLKGALNGVNLEDENEYRLFGEYLVVKHGPERLAEGLRVFADDRKNSTAFMERRAEELEGQYPEFKAAANRLYTFIKDFYNTWAVDTGLISQGTLDRWGERWEYYVPLNRDVGDKNRIGAKRGFANQNSTIKKARGSGLDFIHPVDNLINNIVRVVNAGTRNNVMRVITNSAEAMGADALFLEKVPTPMKATKMNMAGLKADLSKKIKNSSMKVDDQIIADEIVKGLDDILLQFGRGKAHGDVITVLKNGEPEFWKINDPLLLSSITTMSPKAMEGILDAYAVVSRFMTANITGNNVVWSLFSNFPRDIMTLFTYSKTKNPAKLFSSIGSAYVNKVNNSLGKDVDQLYREFLAMGGGSVSAYTADRDLAKRAKKSLAGKKISANPLDWIAFTGDLIESGPRFATYKLLREAGVEPQEAFYGAMDITVNFRRGGRVSRELNKIIPFFNASVQGLDKFRRWITAEDVGKLERGKVIRSRTISYIAASAVLAAIVYALNNGDDEKEKDYEQLSNYQKNSYWNIPLGDGKYFAIPKPREIGVLSSFFETCMEYGIGKNIHAFEEFYEYATDNFLPSIASDVAQIGQKGPIDTGMNIVGSLGIIGVVGYLGANRDFLGNPIVSSGLQNLEKKDQYTNRTSKIAYWLGQAFNASPVQIDYFFQQVLGGWWKYQKALFPVGKENVDLTLGVRNSYVKDNQYSTDIIDWLYDKANASAKAKNSDVSNIDKAIEAKLDSNMTTFYSRYYKLAKDKPETELRRSVRQVVLDMMFEYRKIDDSGEYPKMQAAINEACKEIGSTEYLPGVMPVEVKDGNGIKYPLSDTQYVEFQTDYLRIYWETLENTFSYSMSAKEKAAVLEAAKTVAKEQAVSCVLARVGGAKSEYEKKYGGIANDDMTEYFAAVSMAGSDGKTNQSEVIDAILGLNLKDDESYKLFTSRYERKSAMEAWEYDIPADLYLTAIIEMGKITGTNRREQIERYLNSVCDNYSDYLFLLGTEYESVKKDEDYIMYFGEQ